LQDEHLSHSLPHPPLVVFFDLGGVVVDVDLQRARCAWAAELGTSESDFDRVFLDSGIKDAMDVGKITRSQALRDLCALCASPVAEEVIVRCWSSSISPRPEVSEMVHEVARNARCAVISNTDPVHAEYIKAVTGISTAIERWVTSYQAGSMKPEIGILRLALQHLAVHAEDALLVDDREENLVAARSLGMDGLHYDNFESVRRGLAARGLLGPGWLPLGSD